MALSALRFVVVAGVALVAVAGLLQALDLDGAVATLRGLGAGLVLVGVVAEAVQAPLGAPAKAAAVAAPALAAGLAGAWVLASGPEDRAVNEPVGTLVAVGAPILAASLRALAGGGGSTWYVGFAGALAGLVGAAIVAVGGGPGPEAAHVLGLAGALLLTYAVTHRDEVTEAANSRSAVYGGGALVLVALSAALGVGAYALARRDDHTFDLTRGGVNTLADQSRTVAAAAPEGVVLEAWFGRQAVARPAFAELAQRFVEASGGRISVEWLDPLAEPARAEAAEVTTDEGTVIVRLGERSRRLEGEIVEEDLARVLSVIGSAEEHEVCWVRGHGEPDPDSDFGATGYGGARAAIELGNYQVVSIEPARTGIPASCDVVLAISRGLDWMPHEREALAAWLASGGQVFLMIDPFVAPELAAELDRYGITVGQDIVVDENRKARLMGVRENTSVVLSAEDFGDHPITRNLAAALLFPGARSVRARRDAEGVEVRDLLRTSPDAWGETDPAFVLDPSVLPRPEPGLEVVGEVPVLAIAEIRDPAALDVVPPAPPTETAPAETAPPGEPPPADAPFELPLRGVGVPADFAPRPGGRLVVLGNAGFLRNDYLSLGNNRDLLLNVVAWLVEEEAQIGERPEGAETLEITDADASLLVLTSLFGVPGTALAIAAATLLRRRSL